MANVTHEQEAGDALHNATLEVAEELERTLKEQSRLQDDLDSSSDVLTAATKEFAGLHMKPQAPNSATPSGKLAIAEQSMMNSVWPRSFAATNNRSKT